ncbi:MAG: hypothetical protein P8183_15835 [Anaerolineae bacterium]
MTHDYLARRIADWLGNEFWDAQRVRELLRQATGEWDTRRRLLSPGDLRLVNTQRGRVQFNDKEAVVIYASALSYGENTDYWRSQLTEDAVETTLLALTEAAQPFVRARAAQPLADFTAETAAARLVDLTTRDAEAAVREAAAEAIAQTAHQAAVQMLVAAAADPATAAAAETALVIIRDRQTAVADQLPPPLQQKVQRQVWRRRWQRHKWTCLAAAWRGATAGFLGFGLGMGLILASGSEIGSLFKLAPGLALSFILGGMVLSGTGGGLAAGGGGFVLATLNHLSDGRGQRWAWVVSSATTGVILGFSLVALVQFAAAGGERRYLPGWLAGFVIGTIITLVAAAPLDWQRPWPAALTIVAGIGAFLAVGLSGLSLQTETGLLIFAGITTGLGFFWGFSRPEASA